MIKLDNIYHEATSAFVDEAISLTLKRDYGTALFYAFRAHVIARYITCDSNLIRVSSLLLDNLSRLIETEFEEITRRRGITVTPKNKSALMLEHSKHYVRTRNLLSALEAKT